MGFFSRAGARSSSASAGCTSCAGITWIGLLYYFNLVQVPAFAAFGDEARARNIAIDKVARRALWWFRWAAISPRSSPASCITIVTKDYFMPTDVRQAGRRASRSSLGMLLGTIMMLNVWGVIWRNQKVVLANAANVLAGGEADPMLAAAGRKALMASRQNTIFSVVDAVLHGVSSHDSPASAVASRQRQGGRLLGHRHHHHRRPGAQRARLACRGRPRPNKGLNMMYDGPGVRNC